MATTAAEHYQAGQLKEAVAAQAAQVKSHPASTDLRGFLCELLTFEDNLDRIDKHLDVMSSQDPKIALGVAEFRQIVRAEQARRECFASGALPEFVGDPSPLLQKHLRALTMVRGGDTAGAAELLAEAEAERPKTSGVCDGVAFDDFRDLDDVCAPFMEVLTTTGKYFWIPIDQIIEVEFASPSRARDVVWRQAQMSVRGGPDGVVYVPALYGGTFASEEDALRLGRATEWLGAEGEPVRGLGQRMFLAGDVAKTMMEVTMIQFGTPGEGEDVAAAPGESD